MDSYINGWLFTAHSPNLLRRNMKRKKIPENKKLQKECELLWKEIIKLRDGNTCLVRKLFPEIALGHTDVYQADHCFTRGNKHLFLNPANGTMVCSACNMAKHYDIKSVKRAVDYIVRKREGKAKWNDMLQIDMGMSANVNWGKVWWLEDQRDSLTKIRNKYLRLKKNKTL